MPAQEKLNRDDQLVAYTAGLGITIVITAFILMGLGTVDSRDALNFGVLPGVGFIVLGIAVWLAQSQPWKSFDDLTTPAYTGHHHDHGAPTEDPIKTAVSTTIEAVVEASGKVMETVSEKVEAIIHPAKDEKAAPEPVEVAAAPEPQLLAESTADDLVLIEGIGPKSANALNTAGITTFAQVGDMSPGDLERTIKDQGVPLVGSTETWPEQARVAASGDMTALRDLQERIKGVTEPATDALTVIEGLGPKSAEALNAVGITTFAQVAAMSPDDLERAIKDQGVRLVGSTATWPQQAGLAAAGKLSELEEFQSRLKRGILRGE